MLHTRAPNPEGETRRSIESFDVAFVEREDNKYGYFIGFFST
jgi:hypothetical protein